MDMHSPLNAVHDNIISKLESTFGDSLHIQDIQKTDHESVGDDFELLETKLEKGCLKEFSTVPYPDMILHSSSSDEEADTSLTESLSKQSPLQSYSCPVSLAAPPKLVSAMRGNREKHGGSKMKLTVKWAPDVYDPVPSLLSHTVKNKKQQKSRIKKNEKKNGKRGRKVNYSKGGSCKYKQDQNWWLESCDNVIEVSTELDDVDVVSHDSYFGTSYFQKPVTKSYCPGGALSNILEFVSYIKTA